MILFILCFILFLIGIYGVITRRNIIKIIIALAIMENSLNLFFILIGYVRNGDIPIIDVNAPMPLRIVDPLPQALILTSIVIGLATTALLLAIAIRIYKKYKTFDISKINSLKG
jgi:multicomponent Na+:H+ antiporter subunit C